MTSPVVTLVCIARPRHPDGCNGTCGGTPSPRRLPPLRQELPSRWGWCMCVFMHTVPTFEACVFHHFQTS